MLKLNQINRKDFMFYTPTVTSTYNDFAINAGIWAVASLVLALVGGILVYYLFVATKQEPKGKFLKQLKDFLAFKTMWIEAIIKITYYCVTIFAILYSFAFIAINPLTFLFMLIVVPVLIRIGYEQTIMFIVIWRNTKEIADNTSKKKQFSSLV